MIRHLFICVFIVVNNVRFRLFSGVGLMMKCPSDINQNSFRGVVVKVSALGTEDQGFIPGRDMSKPFKKL